MILRRTLVSVLLIGLLATALVALMGTAEKTEGNIALAATSPYGRLVIASENLDVPIKAHKVAVSAQISSGGGVVRPSPLQVVKAIDTRTVPLYVDITQGTHLPKVVVRTFRSNGKMLATYTLEEAVLTGYAHQGAKETLEFTYNKMKIKTALASSCFDFEGHVGC